MISTASISGAALLSGNLELSENSVTTYSLINSLGNSFSGLDSELRVTGGNAIYLYGSGSTIYGREGTPSSASITGAVAFTLVIDQTTGQVTLNQIKPIDHLVDTPTSLPDEVASISSLFYVSASVTNINNASLTVKSTNTIDLKFYDDGPVLTGVNTTNVDKTLNASVTDTFDTTYGADGKASADPLTLTFRGTAPANFSLVQDAVDKNTYYGKTGSQNVFKVVLNDAVAGPENSSYTFTLLNPSPQLILQNNNLLQGISGGSNLPTYTIAASSFDNLFALTLTGWNINRAGSKVANDITISSSALGVGGNTINQSQAEILRFDLGQIDPTATAISLKIGVDTTAGIKNGDQIKVQYFYVGSSSPETDIIFYDNSGFIIINEFDVNNVINYFEISPATTNTNMKIIGLSLEYGKAIPLPNQFDFALVAKDGDADKSTAANFSVTLNTIVSGVPIIESVDIVIADTTANDTFANNSGTLSASDAQNNQITYGINTGVTDNQSIGGVSYDVSKTSAYGTLYVNSTTGQYIFEQNSSAINALSTLETLIFTVTASDGTNTGSNFLTINLFGINDAPTITSGATGSVAENAAISTVVYTATATDVEAGTTLAYSLSGDDAALFNINSSSGAVTLKASADYETKPSYSINVVASDGTLTDPKAVTVNVTNADEVAPLITSGATATAIVENTAAGTKVYQAVATDNVDFTNKAITYSLGGTDAALFTMDASGNVTINAAPNYETKTSYSFDVIATDATGNASSKTVTLNVTNADEVAPLITSGATATAIVENTAAGTKVYQAVATDNVDFTNKAITYSLGGTDAALFTMDASGNVTINAAPNYETKTSYSFDVIATDATGNASSKTVALGINDLNEINNSVNSDTFNLTGAQDYIKFVSGDSDTALTSSGSGGGTILTGFTANTYDKVTSYSLSQGDLLDLPATEILANGTYGTNVGINSTKFATGSNNQISSIKAINGEVSFYTDENATALLAIDNSAKLAAAYDYLNKNLTTGQTVEFSSTTSTYVFQKGDTSHFIELTGLLDNTVNGIEFGFNNTGYIHIM